MIHRKFSTPIGVLTAYAEDDKLVAIEWPTETRAPLNLGESSENPDDLFLMKVEKQISEYFSGKRETFDIPFQMRGTAFQKAVWHELLKIPFGKTKTYGEIAESLGNAKASRAVGAANGRNPLSIVVPCHRVIGTGGKLTGFAGGVDLKEKLLTIEKKVNS